MAVELGDIYIAMAQFTQKHGHQPSGQQCCIKAKALRGQWVHMRGYNMLSGTAMPFMRKLAHILPPMDPVEA